MIKDLDKVGLMQYFMLGAPIAPRTILKDVKDYEWLKNNFILTKDDIKRIKAKRISIIDVVRGLKNNIKTKGALLLSGGVDSTAVLHMLSEKYGRINTYTAGFDIDVEKYNFDLMVSRNIAEKYSTNHHEIIINERKFIKSFYEMLEKNKGVLVGNVGNVLINIVVKNIKEKVVFSGNNAGILFTLPSSNFYYILYHIYFTKGLLGYFSEKIVHLFPTHPSKLKYPFANTTMNYKMIYKAIRVNEGDQRWYYELISRFYYPELNNIQNLINIWSNTIAINVFRRAITNGIMSSNKIHITPYYSRSLYIDALSLSYRLRYKKRGYKIYWRNKLKAPFKGGSMFPPVWYWSNYGELREIIFSALSDAKIVNKNLAVKLFNSYISGKKYNGIKLEWDYIYRMWLLEEWASRYF